MSVLEIILLVAGGAAFISSFFLPDKGGEKAQIPEEELERLVADEIEKNRSVGHFDEEALRRRLDKHLTLTLYSTIVERYFADGYPLPRYLRYLASGLALHTGRRYETKFLLKSLLHRKD